MLDTTHTYEVCLWRGVLDTMPADPDLTPTQARQLKALQGKFAKFPALGTELVPQNSLCGNLSANNAVQFTENIHLRVANRAAIGYNRPKSHGRVPRRRLVKEVYNHV